MIDLAREIAAVQRSVGRGQLPVGEGHVVRLRRTLDAPIDDVWDAVTNPTRISRWFMPVSGEFHVGGRYQLEGNAGGEILACEPPRRFRVTWIYGEGADPMGSAVEIRLAPSGSDRTDLELEHTAIVPDEMWDQFGPGAVGVGWDGALLGLTLHLRGGSVEDPVAWQLSEEGRAFSTRSSKDWGAAYRASGAAADVVARAIANTTSFYAPDPEAS